MYNRLWNRWIDLRHYSVVLCRDKNIFTCLESSLETRRTVCRRAFLSEKILHGTPR